MTAVWLASGSPRRRQLLEAAGLQVDVRPADVDESWDRADTPVEHAVRLARRKAATGPADRIVVAADTVVHLGAGDAARIFDRSADRAEARAHLLAIEGRWHDVTTGVCVRRGDDERAFPVTTRVRMRALQLAEIERYLATGEADDKAGAYGIQGAGGGLVAELQGSYTNVVGLPVEETLAAIAELAGRTFTGSMG